MRKHRPVRTCIGCGAKSDKNQLLRIASQAGSPLADPMAIRPGRGAYLCYKLDCLHKVVKRRGFYRLYKSAGTETLITDLEELISGNEE